MYHNWHEDGRASFPDWEQFGGTLGGVPIAVSWGEGRLDVFAPGTDRMMRHWWFDRTADTGWRGPETLGATTFAGTPAAVSWASGRIDVFGRDTNGALRHNWVERDLRGFAEWETLATGLGSDPAAVSWAKGRLDIFAPGTDRMMRHWWFDRAGAAEWLGERLGATTFTTTIAVASWEPGRLDVFGVDTNGAMRHNWYQRGATIFDPLWENLHGIFH